MWVATQSLLGCDFVAIVTSTQQLALGIFYFCVPTKFVLLKNYLALIFYVKLRTDLVNWQFGSSALDDRHSTVCELMILYLRENI
jgi:hypothetical protein